ncbi:hypothetical protein CP533_0760 [Ophiocordyceps camponoti-saundersi (nom. inval.)]|nr:hypothetical protein CP533_0760 [Ophiocordyceps camponoti-saundersi (nom. inval.)]
MSLEPQQPPQQDSRKSQSESAADEYEEAFLASPLLLQEASASLYYEASTMAALNAASSAAINRLRSYRPPPFPLWDALPTRKRAAVLVLLYADRMGDLRVVITMRAASLRNFSGHAALPGGKADNEDETPFQIARREAFEEIGLPIDDDRLPSPFRIEPLCLLPPSLARTHLVVRPCVAFLHADRSSSDRGQDESLLVEESMIPRLDAREVAALFSAPLYNFLKVDDLPPPPGQLLPPGHWYDGTWTSWKNISWRSHNFYVPVNNQRVMRPRRRSSASSGGGGGGGADLGAVSDEEERFDGRLKVWGMTGRLLVDAARIAYDEKPEMEHNESFGDFDVIMTAMAEGALDDVRGHDVGDGGPAKM